MAQTSENRHIPLHIAVIVKIIPLLLVANHANAYPAGTNTEMPVSRTIQSQISVTASRDDMVQTSRIAPTKSPPNQVEKAATTIVLDACKTFSHRVPIENLIHDNNNNAQFILSDENNSPVPKEALIRFNSSSKTIHGVLTQQSHTKYNKLRHHYILRQKNRTGLENEIHFSLKLPPFLKRWNYKLFVKLGMKTRQHGVDVITSVMKKIADYFKDENTSFIYPISHEMGTDYVIFQWSNHSLVYPACSVEEVSEISRKVFSVDGSVEKSFRNLFNQEFRFLDAGERRSEFCLPRIHKESEEFRKIFRRSLGSVETRKTRPKRSMTANTAPVINGEIGIENATYCNLFIYNIQDDLFTDKEDGNLSNLTLSLHTKNGDEVGKESWLQLQKSLLTLYGYLKDSDAALADENSLIHYQLIATDSGGMSKSLAFSVRIPVTQPKIFYKVELTVNNFENDTKPDVNEEIFIAVKIVSYFEDQYFWGVNILSFERNTSANRVTFGWTNCSLTGDTCPEREIETLIRKVVNTDGRPNADFATQLKPQYTIYDIKATRVGECAANLSASATATASVTPVKGLSPRINSIIPELTVTTTTYFSYQISAYTFYDSIDGYTRNLSLSLRTSTNAALSRSSWLQFDSKTQTMYGILTSMQFNGNYVKTFTFYLIATNSRGFSTQISVNLRGSRQTVSFGARISISGRDNSQYTTNDVMLLTRILTKLRGYLPQTSMNAIEVASFQRTLVGQQRLFTLVYSNISITTNNCEALTQLTPLIESQGNLINPDLTIALTPDVVADRVDVTRLGACVVSSLLVIKPSPTSSSLYPEVKNPVPLIDTQSGFYFYYQITPDTFYDAMDGNTSKLSLTLVYADDQQLGKSSWVQFDAAKQHIYGLLTASQQTYRPYQYSNFKLTARNSLGYAASQTIQIRSTYMLSNIGFEVTLNGREYSTIQLNDIQMQYFILTKLRQYLGITSNSTIAIISFQRQLHASSLFSIRFTDTRLTSVNCNQELLRNIESKIVSSPAVIHRDLIQAFTPSTVLYDASIRYFGTCSNTGSSITPSPSPAVNTPQYFNKIPRINATYGISFRFQIPRDTFRDSIDGDTRSLKLSLVNIDGTQLSSSSLVNLNISDQMLYGLVTNPSQGSNRVYMYSLVALNSRGFRTTVSISIYVSKYQQSIGLSITTSLLVRYSTSTTELQLMRYFLTNINQYFKYSVASSFVIRSFIRKIVPKHELVVTWSYSIIHGASCNQTALQSMTSMLQSDNGQPNTDFITAMSPGFRLYTVSLQKLQTCKPFETSSTLHAFSSTEGPIYSKITPSKHTPYISSTASVIFGQPPKVTSRIPPLFAYFCTSFSYLIPENLFFDEDQGNTRQLQLRLEMSNGNQVSSSSWLQFSQSSQSIYGILKVEDFHNKPAIGYKYYLTAVDNKGQTARTDFTITIPMLPPQINHVITMQFDRVFDKTVPDVNEQLLMVTKILNYFNDGNENKVNMISYAASSIGNNATIEWSNCSLQYTPCPHAQLNVMLDRMIKKTGDITENFRKGLAPYAIRFIKAEKLYPCNQSIVTQSTFLRTTIKPSPSIGAPPILQHPVPQMNITWCAPFEYQLPDTTFYDTIDGSTRNLTLTLQQLDGLPNPASSWLIFDASTQTIRGYPQVSDLSGYELKRYLLVATNKIQLSTTQIISVKVTKPKPNPNHQLRVTTTAYLNSNMADADARTFIWRRMKLYLKSSTTELMSFNNFTRTSNFPSQLKFTFSNCSLPEDRCDQKAFESMLGNIFTPSGVISSDFIMAFAPEIVITAVNIESLGLCTQLTSSYRAPSTSYLQSSSIATTNTPPTRNLPPLVLRAIGTLYVDSCTVFTYIIPEGTFYDMEDGLTRSLTLNLTGQNNSALKPDSWLKFDSTLQKITGIIIHNKIVETNFVLTATDKGGLTATTSLNFNIRKSNRPTYSTINMTATGYFSQASSNVDILNQFISKLTTYLAHNKENSIRVLSFDRTTSSTLNLRFSWTLCGECNTTALEKLRGKLLITTNRINPDLVIALGPQIIVMEVKNSFIMSCPTSAVVTTTTTTKSTTTTTAATTTVRITIISAAYSPTLPVSSYILASSITVYSNTPPRFVNTVPDIITSLCEPFYLAIPADLYYDFEDSVSEVSIDIAYRNGTALSQVSMLQYSQVNRTIYGVVKQSDLDSYGRIKERYLVKCVDSQGLNTTKDLNITSPDTKLNDTHAVTFYSYIYSISSLSDVDIQLLWMKKLQSYMQNKLVEKMHFLYFTRLSNIQTKFSVKLCDLNVCNTTAYNTIRDKTFSTIPFLNADFVEAMFPEFSLISAEFAENATSCGSISPGYTTSIFDTAKTQTIVLSSSAVYDSPPVVRRHLPTLNITLCKEFKYRIPEDTFYDSKEGYSRNLTVSLRNTNGSTVDESSWVQYDAFTLTIYGYLTQHDLINGVNFNYRLVATDRSGNSAGLSVNLTSLSNYKVVSHSFSTIANVHTKFANDVQIRTKLESKIKAYFGSQLSHGLMFVNFTKFDGSTPRVGFAWSACALVDKCDRESVKTIADKMLFYGTVLNFEYIGALAPDFIVTKVSLNELQSCITSSSKITKVENREFSSTFRGHSTTLAHAIIQSKSTVSYDKYGTTSEPLLATVITSTTPILPVSHIKASTAYKLVSSTLPSMPKVTKPLPNVTVSLCSLLRLKIPDDTFYDEKYGNRLRLSARLTNGQNIPGDSWVQYLEMSQTFVGQATIQDYVNQPHGGYMYIVRATNQDNYYTETPITFNVKAVLANHNISVSIEDKSTLTISNFETISLIRRQISSYFGDSTKDSIGVLEYDRNTTMSRVFNVTWYNCTIAQTACDRRKIHEYYSRIVSSNGDPIPSFAAAFTNYKIRSIKAVISESCRQINGPTSKYTVQDVISSYIATSITQTNINFPKPRPTFANPTYSKFTMSAYTNHINTIKGRSSEADLHQSTSIASSLVPTDTAVNSYESRASSTSRLITPTTIIPNMPPNAEHSLVIKLTYCSKLNFKISNDTFTDKEDGGTENLQLTLLDENYRSPGCNFTLQYNDTVKEIQGFVSLAEWRRQRVMKLQARDSGGLMTFTNVTFELQSPPSNSTFSVTLNIKIIKPQTLCWRDVLQYLGSKLSHYFHSENVTFLSTDLQTSKREMTVKFTFCSAYTLRCNLTNVIATSKKILNDSQANENLSRLLLPDIMLLNASIHTSSACLDTRIVNANITYCSSFNYSLQESITSSIRGIGSNTNELTYSLEPLPGDTLPLWMKFDSKTMTLQANPIYDSIRNRNATEMVLVVKHQTIIVSRLILQLNHPTSTIVNQNFIINLKMLSYIESSVKDYDLIDLILERLSNITEISKHELLVIDYSRKGIFPQTIDIKIMPCFSQHNCNTTKADEIVDKIITNKIYPTYSLVQNMLPDFVMQNIRENRTKACINNPPATNIRFMNITVRLCTELNKPVRNNTFYDQEEQTSDLAYELRDNQGRKIGLDSWVQFDNIRRVIYGVPSRVDLINQPEDGYVYILKASDSAGLASNITVNITIKGETENSVYEVTMIFKSVPDFKTNTDVLLGILSKIGEYFGDVDSSFIGVVSFTRGIGLDGNDRLVWTNCSLTNESCDISTVATISQKLLASNGSITQGITNALGSNYTVGRITQQSFGVCINTTNSAPKMNASLPMLNISSCMHLRYRIPKNTFTDQEDGNTRSLLLYLKTQNGRFLNSSSWVQLDTVTQTLYAIATYDVIRNQPISGYYFNLHAQDSKGAEVLAPLRIRWTGNTPDRHLIEMVMRMSDIGTSSKLSKQRKFLSSSAKCLNTTEDALSVAYYSKARENYISISVYDKCGNTSSICSEASIRDLYKRLTANASKQRSKYVDCMAPEISIMNITIVYARSCITAPSNMPPIVNNRIPLLNMSMCSALYYKIPNDTFVDADMERLTLRLLQYNGEPLMEDDFIQFDASSKTIYGLIAQPMGQKSKALYVLQARDVKGAKANTTIQVRLLNNISTLSYQICLSLIRYSTTTATKIGVIIDVMARISLYLGDESRDSLLVNNHSVTNQYPRSVHLCFSNCSLGNKKCDYNVIESMRARIFLRSEIIRPEFARALAPNYVVTKATELLSEICYLTSTIASSTVYKTSSIYLESSLMLSTYSNIITQTPVSTCLSGKNNRPRIINSIKKITVGLGQPTAYQIASDVAYDTEDGSLAKMQAKITDSQGNKIENSWISFDDKNKTIYISYLDEGEEISIQKYQFRLVVADSCGTTVFDAFEVEIIGSVPCCYVIQTVYNMTYNKNLSSVKLQYQIYQHLKRFYNDTQNGIQIYSAVANTYQNITDNSSSVLMFTNNSLTNVSCSQRDVDQFSSRVFYANGTVIPAFLGLLAPFSLIGVKGRYNKHCNATAILIPPLIPALPGVAKARTYHDWLWYILPFVILAFLIIFCCLLFYWCQSCCELCRGEKKAKGFDPFGAVAANALEEDPVLSKAAVEKAAEAAAVEAAVAAAPLDPETSSDPPFEDLYAQIAPRSGEDPVPSLHKDSKPKSKMPSWNSRAAEPEDDPDEPVTGGVAALPNTDDLPNDDVTAGVAALPQGPTSEDPISADVAPMSQTQLPSSSTSVVSSEDPWSQGAAPMPQDEDPMTMLTAPVAQGEAPMPVTEEAITPTQRPGTQAAPPPRLLTEGRPHVTETMTTLMTENRYHSSAELQFSDSASNSQYAPALRLPPTPGPNEPPPPYSPPKTQRTSNQVITRQTQSFSQVELQNQLKSDQARSTRSDRQTQRILRPITQDTMQSSLANDQVVIERSTEPRLQRRQSRPRFVLVEESSPIPEKTVSPINRLYTRRSQRVKDRRPSLVVRRKSISPTRQRKRPVYVYSEPRATASEGYDYVSPSLLRRFKRKPSKKARKYLYASDTESEKFANDREVLYSPRKTYSDVDASGSLRGDDSVPIEIQGTFKAPEKVLRKWFKESTLESATNNSPKTRQRKRQKSFKGKTNTEYTNFIDEADTSLERSNRTVRRNDIASNRGSARRRNIRSYTSDDTALGSPSRTSPKSPQRSLKRGYPYSKGHYEYVETALKTRPARRRDKDREMQLYLDGVSRGSVIDDSSYVAFSGQRNSQRRRSRSVEEIFARLSRRKDMKRKREAAMNYSEA